MHLFTLTKHTSLFIFGFFLCSVASLRAAVWNLPSAPVQQAQVNVQDGDLITDDGGQAGAYSSLYRGALTLVPPPGMIVRLEFLSFNLETDFDNLAAFDGPNTLHPLLLCQSSGSALPPVITGTRTEGLTLFMTSDGSDERDGFVARVVLLPAGAPPAPLTDFNIAALGHETLTVCGGTLYDQGGPACDYLHNSGYQYDNNGFPVPDGFTTLVPDQAGHVIRIEFQDFAFETLTSEDDLWIFDGNDDQAPLIGEYRVNPGTITADNGLAPNPDGSLTLWMVSDFIFNAAGFRARISCVPRPDAVISGAQTICNGETASLTVDLSGTPPFSFTYTDNGQSVEVTNWNLPQYTFDVTPGIGDHVFEIVSVADANLTQLRAPLTPSSAVVTVIAGPTANFAAPQYQTCGGNPVTVRINLTGVAPYSFSYSDGTNVFDVNGHNGGQFEFTVSPASSTIYQLLSVSDAQCSTGRIVQDQTLVVVSPPPAASLVGASAAGVCPGGSADLIVELTGSGPWNLTYTDGTQQHSVNGVANSPLRIPVQPSAITNYSLVSVTTANCPPGQVGGQTQLVIFPEPAIDVSTSVSCDDGTRTITLNGSGGTAPYLYSFDGGLVWGQANSAKRPPSPNPYPVAVRDANGCRKDATALVQGLPAPRITDFLAITQTSMAVVWTSVPGVGVYYSLRYRIAGSAMPWVVIPFVFDTKRMVGGLQSNTRYEFQVKVICGGGLESDWSEIEEETTLPGDPADCSLAVRAPWPMPGSFYYDQLTSRSVRLNWGSVAGPGYIVAWGKAEVNPNNWPQDVVCNLNPLPATTTYIIQGLSPGTTYRARVRTNCSNCTSALQSTDRRSAWTQVIEFTTPIAREDAASSIDETLPQLSLYPNPNDGRFTVTGLPDEPFSAVNWRMFDLNGRILIEGTGQIDGDSTELHFDLSDQSAGLYLLELVSGNRKHHIKVWIR